MSSNSGMFDLLNGKKHMHLLTHGKESFLEFLRNLGPQIIIFVAVIVLQIKLPSVSSGVEWYKQVALLVALWATWGLAFLANLNNFIEKFTNTVPEFKDYERNKGQGTWKLIKLLWKARKSFFFELMVVATIIEVSIVVVILSSMAGAFAAITNLHIDIK